MYTHVTGSMMARVLRSRNVVLNANDTRDARSAVGACTWPDESPSCNSDGASARRASRSPVSSASNCGTKAEQNVADDQQERVVRRQPPKRVRRTKRHVANKPGKEPHEVLAIGEGGVAIPLQCKPANHNCRRTLEAAYF